jgi:hypothetical protein
MGTTAKPPAFRRRYSRDNGASELKALQISGTGDSPHGQRSNLRTGRPDGNPDHAANSVTKIWQGESADSFPCASQYAFWEASQIQTFGYLFEFAL